MKKLKIKSTKTPQDFLKNQISPNLLNSIKGGGDLVIIADVVPI